MAATLLSPKAAVTVEHLSESDVAGYLDQDLAPEARGMVEAHLDACAECRGAVAEVRRLADAYTPVMADAAEFEQPRPVRVPPPVGRPVPSWRKRPVRVGATLAVAAALVIAVLVQGDRADQVDALRSGGRPAAGISSIASMSPPDGAVVDRERVEFHWRATGSAVFRFALLDETGAPVWVHETTATSVTLPAEVELGSGESYFWRVDALADGITASTTASRFTVR